MIAVWIPVTVVPTSLATVAIETFMTELSSVMRNCPAANVSSTVPAAVVRVATLASLISGSVWLSAAQSTYLPSWRNQPSVSSTPHDSARRPSATR